MKLLLAALACAGALVAAGCGEKQDVLEPSGSKHIDLMLDYFPNADHAGIYAAQAGGDFKEAGLDVAIRHAVRPRRADQAGGGRAGGPRDLVRARGAAGPRPGAEGRERRRRSCRSRSRRSSRCRRRRSREPADLKGKTVGTAGIDYQEAYLEDDPGRRGREPLDREGAQRRLRLQPRADHRQDRRGAGRVLELRGRGPAAARQAPADHPHREGRRADLQRAGPGGERGRPQVGRRQDPRVHRRGLARHARPAPRPEHGRSRGC